VESAKCKTLFITHYPLLASEIARLYREVANEHMSFVEEGNTEGTRTISFLYRLAPGMARSSYGIECAMLAGLRDEILEQARARSTAMETTVTGRRDSHRLQAVIKLVKELTSKPLHPDSLHEGLCQLKSLQGSRTR